MKISCFLFGHHNLIIGHREVTCINLIELVSKCSKCGKIEHNLFRQDDPWIDEDSPNRIKPWSGYTWWMYRPLDENCQTK